jgi:hypothetical protein
VFLSGRRELQFVLERQVVAVEKRKEAVVPRRPEPGTIGVEEHELRAFLGVGTVFRRVCRAEIDGWELET